MLVHSESLFKSTYVTKFHRLDRSGRKESNCTTTTRTIPHGKNDGGICITFCTDYKFNLKSMDDDKLVSTPLKKKQQQDQE